MDLYFFYVVRPWFLLLLLPVWGMVWLLLENQDDHKVWKRMIDKHLLPHLLLSQGGNSSSVGPSWLIGVLLTLMVVALSGPSWQKKPELFSDDQSELVFVFKVTDSMLEKDLIPNRLTRAVFKMHDLLKARSRLRAALVAYSGSAHLVMPLTQDSRIVSAFAQSLEPGIMPVRGDALADAIRVALKQFTNSTGTIIVLCDSLNPVQIKLIENDPELKHARVVLYAIASPELLNLKQIKNESSKIGADMIILSPDDSDIKSLLKSIENNFKRAQNDRAEYEDGGYFFIPAIALFVLLWFRRGFLAEAWRIS